MRRAFHVAALFLLGTLLAQVAWIVAVPPYRGSDEFDHVYRAASVAAGYWRPDWEAPADGRGDLIPAPRQLVEDGREVCLSYDYVGADNCRAVTELGGGLVTVASAAARYNPVFYWLIGEPAQVAEGARSLYLMRAASAVLSALLIAVAAWTLALWSRSRWPLTTLLVAMTPVVLYSTAMPAPNGVEMAGGLCLWAGFLGFATEQGRRQARPLLLVAATGAAVLGGVRTLGPLWLAFALATAVFAIGYSSLERVIRRNLGLTLWLGVLVGGCAVAGLAWSRGAKTNSLEVLDLPDVSPWGPALGEVPLWFFQSIAAFPLRSEPAPMIVYACETLIFLALVAFAFVQGSNRLRWALGASATLSLAIPFAITIATVLTAGLVWQGRYTLPYSLGVALIAGLSLELARPATHRWDRLLPPLLVAGSIALIVSHVVSVVHVQWREEQRSPLFGDPRWIHAPMWAVGLITALSVCIWIGAILRFGTGTSTPSAIDPAALKAQPSRSTVSDVV